MADDNMTGRFSSFYEMTSSPDPRKKFDLIVIPMIQRDYAQGRPGKEVLRDNFLSTLFSAIDSDDSERVELDFIYGKKDPKERLFLPVDGQQRMTTLFLLHLYLAKRCGADTSSLEPFTYEVRHSSKDFIKRLLEIAPEHFIGLEEYVGKQWWFNSRWKNDPTISSMLVMISAIDKHYASFNDEEIAKVWNRLSKDDKIGFWLLNLEDLDTTDDLYIKMNSRGQQLTEFEHFKAQIEGRINKERKEGRLVATDFSRKVDTDWTSLLWSYRTNFDADPEKYFQNSLDEHIQNLFRNFMIIEGTKAGIEFAGEDGSVSVIGIDMFRKMNILKLADTVLGHDISLVDRFRRILDFFYIWSKNRPLDSFFNEILTSIPFEEFRGVQDENNYRVYMPDSNGNLDFLKVALGPRVNNIDLLYVEAFFEVAFLNDVKDFNFSYVRDSIRIIRNLILNSPDNIRQENMSVLLKRVDALVKDSEDLDPEESNSFLQIQVRQEMLKCEWMKNHPSDRLSIMFIENHSLLLGDISAYADEKRNIVYASSLLAHASFFVPEIRDKLDRIESLALTFGDYGADAGWKRMYGGYVWDNWMNDIFARADSHSGRILRNMLEDFPIFDEEKVKEHIRKWLEQCEEEKLYPWTYYLVKYPYLRAIDAARYQKVYWDNNRYNWQMLNSPSRRGWYQFAFLWVIHCKLDESHKNSSEFRAKGDPLYIKRLKWTVFQTETGYRIEYKENRERKEYQLDIPRNDKGIDRSDRILTFLSFLDSRS